VNESEKCRSFYYKITGEVLYEKIGKKNQKLIYTKTLNRLLFRCNYCFRRKLQ